MNKFFYLQMDSGEKAPLLISAMNIQGLRYSTDTETLIYTSSTTSDDIIRLFHDSDTSSSLKMPEFLVNELEKLLSTTGTNVAPLLIPPVPITSYTIS